ncbi:MAG: heavy metal-associated domain-containing protein [Bacteroidales bacterium]|nr:heavy metal-associated domain-containing protein [Bacteroidales bacterium]MDD3664935.1 heavy metal-associated domain-containing protein [Bacteroidales bacterium]
MIKNQMMKLSGISLLVMLMFSTITLAQAQNKKGTELKIKTSAQCGMCKDRIEKAMAYEKGVFESDLNLEDKTLTLRYNPKKTSPEKIRKALNDVGYDADDTKADQKAYSKLPDCCKKPEDRHQHGEGCSHDKH